MGRASRLFQIASLLTLAVGIGGTTAIFTLIDAVILRPLPVTDPSRLYRAGDGDDTIEAGRHGRWEVSPRGCDHADGDSAHGLGPTFGMLTFHNHRSGPGIYLFGLVAGAFRA